MVRCHRHSACCCPALCAPLPLLLVQEPDAGRADNKDDPDFGVSKEEMSAADAAAAEEPAAGGHMGSRYISLTHHGKNVHYGLSQTSGMWPTGCVSLESQPGYDRMEVTSCLVGIQASEIHAAS